MINKIKDLFSKLNKKNNNSEDLDSDDFTQDVPSFDKDQDDIKAPKVSFKEKLHALKLKLTDKFRSKKTMQVPPEPKSSLKTKSKKNLNIKAIEDLFFKNQSQNKLHKIFQVLTIFLIVFTVAKISSITLEENIAKDSLEGVSLVKLNYSRDLQVKTIDKIRIGNLFNTGVVKPSISTPTKKEEPKVDLACVEADKKSRLPIKLINTIVLQNSIKSIASIQVNSESLFRELRVGEKIDNMAKIGKIERLRLIVKNLKTGTCEAIESSAMSELASPIRVLSKAETKTYKRNLKPIAGIKNEGNKFTIEKSFIKEKMKNIGQILTEAVGTQINNSDGTISFKITNIVPGSLFSHLGIRDGDIISGMGGEKITDFNKVMGTFSKLSTLDQTSITVKRNGAEVVQEYKFQ